MVENVEFVATLVTLYLSYFRTSGFGPGRPRARWTDKLRIDTGSVPANLCRLAILRGHGGATRRPELATR